MNLKDTKMSSTIHFNSSPHTGFIRLDCTMIVRDFYQAYLKIVANPQLNGFFDQPYGLELLFYLYFRQSDGLETSIDKIFFELTTPVPRREAFGRYLEKPRLQWPYQKNTTLRKEKHESSQAQ